MKVLFGSIAAVASLGLALPTVSAQVNGNPPSISIIRWEVAHAENIGGVPFYGDSIIVYDRDGSVGTPASIANFIHFELDIIAVTVDVVDPDWIEPITTDPMTGELQNNNEPAFLRFRAFSDEFWAPPNPTPIAVFPEGFFPEEEGFRPIPGPTTPYHFFYTFFFRVPTFVGQNQLKLSGLIDFDVAYVLEFCATNEKDDETVYGCRLQDLFVNENPAFRPPNPQAFADAGPDRTVATGTKVRLDASRTLDATNIGFNPNDPNIFEKDNITYTWEWLSGPVRVNPIQDVPSNPIAEVTLAALGTYEFRVSVDDGSSTSLPNFDTVKITVVESIPPNNSPTAVIVGPANAIQLGQIIQLDGRQSFDPDGDELTYRWRQINEVGEPLTGPDLLRAFQPLSGVDSSVSTWQAVNPGTFNFRLLVDDGEFLVNTTFTVRVIDTTVSGRTVVQSLDDSQAQETDTAQASDSISQLVPACGMGAGLVGFVPLGLLLMRRRA